MKIARIEKNAKIELVGHVIRTIGDSSEFQIESLTVHITPECTITLHNSVDGETFFIKSNQIKEREI